MSIAKMLNRLRRVLAKALDAKPTLPTRASHSAYPETQIADDGSWVLRFYAYEPVGWMYQGVMHGELPADFPEPDLEHPTTYAVGMVPAGNEIAWRQHYANRPQPVTLLETLTGQAKNRDTAAKDAYRALRGRVNHYRRH